MSDAYFRHLLVLFNLLITAEILMKIDYVGALRALEPLQCSCTILLVVARRLYR